MFEVELELDGKTGSRIPQLEGKSRQQRILRLPFQGHLAAPLASVYNGAFQNIPWSRFR
jgi:hypothetical protein